MGKKTAAISGKSKASDATLEKVEQLLSGGSGYTEHKALGYILNYLENTKS